jgi:hypothetical protein
MKKIILKSAIIIGATTPLLAFAQQKNLAYLVAIAVQYLGYAVYLIMGLAIVMFVWNVYKYFIAGGDNAEKKGEAGMYVMWSVIGFFVILSFWGLVNILTNTIRLDNYAPANGIFGSFRSTSGGTTVTTGGTRDIGNFDSGIIKTGTDSGIIKTGTDSGIIKK